MNNMARIYIIILLAILPFISTSDDGNNDLVEWMDIWNTFLHHPGRTIDYMFQHNEPFYKHKKHCPGCINDPRMNELRKNLVKNQILRKLRLNGKPVVSDAKVPSPVAAGETMLRPHLQDREDDEFFGKMDQKIVFTDDESITKDCEGVQQHPSGCFSFELPSDIADADIYSSELWIYKLPDPLDGYKQTFVVTEAAHWDKSNLHVKPRPVAIHDSDLKEGWIKIEVGWAVGGWLKESKTSLTVSCRTCGHSSEISPIELIKPDYRPFLVINTRHTVKKRPSRSLDCHPGMTDCCRERLNVKFADIGWDNFIIHPKTYNAYYCRGSCSSVASVSVSGSSHNSVIKKLLHTGVADKREVKPCCAPTAFSSLQIIYMDSNNTASQRTLSDMVVESCGCL